MFLRCVDQSVLEMAASNDSFLAAYRRALAVADDLGARTVAFPLISAGSDGWPKTDAIDAALEVFRAAQTQVAEARMVAFDSSTYAAIQDALRRG